jgi:hypothetical protein
VHLWFLSVPSWRFNRSDEWAGRLLVLVLVLV